MFRLIEPTALGSASLGYVDAETFNRNDTRDVYSAMRAAFSRSGAVQSHQICGLAGERNVTFAHFAASRIMHEKDRGAERMQIYSFETLNRGANATQITAHTGVATKQKLCVDRNSVMSIKINKYLIRNAVGIQLDTVMPDGSIMGDFATEYVYSEHLKRVLLKRQKFEQAKKRQYLSP